MKKSLEFSLPISGELTFFSPCCCVSAGVSDESIEKGGRELVYILYLDYQVFFFFFHSGAVNNLSILFSFSLSLFLLVRFNFFFWSV